MSRTLTFILVLIGFICSFFWGSIAFAAIQTHSATLSPGSFQDYSFSINSETDLRLSLPADTGVGSHLLLKQGAVPVDNNDYDFSSKLDGVNNELYLQAPELSSGTWYVRVFTPASAVADHSYTLTIATDTDAQAGGPYPISKSLAFVNFSGLSLSLIHI